MKAIFKFFILIAFGGLISCEAESLEPRKNPRFSIAFVQELNLSGAEFAATVYEFGDEEILEYGFVYGKTNKPRIENSDYISREGKPSFQYSIKATHSMVSGEKYYVSAYMRTPTSYVYSEPVEFESRGSSGFIYQGIYIPDEVYFNDTITVFATDLSKIYNNYTVTVESERAKVVEIGEDYFKFLMPYGIEFKDKLVSDNIMNFHFTVASKTMELNAPFNFKKPQFNIIPNQKVNYDDRVFIEGDFMESMGEFQIFYVGDNFLRRPLSGTLNSKTRISFIPSVNFRVAKPNVEVVIRGESYIIENSFELNPTEFLPGQEFSVKTSQLIGAKVLNKNIYDFKFNEIVTADKKKPLELISSPSDEVRFVMRMQEGLSRVNQLYLDNFGELSKSYITVHITDPIFMNAKIPERFFNTQRLQGGRGVSANGKGYFFAGKEVYRFDPVNQTFVFVSQSHAPNVFKAAELFALRAPNGLIYTGSDNMANNTKPLDFFEFDPTTEKYTTLPKIPSTAISPLAVYATGKYLYYDGGFEFLEGVGLKPSNERWRYDFLTKNWEKVEDNGFEMGTNRRRYATFYYKSKLLMLAYDVTKNSNTKLLEFDEYSQNWIFKRDLDFAENPSSNEIFVFEDTAYAIFPNGFVSIDLINYQTTLHNFIDRNTINNNFHPLQSVSVNGRIYIYNGKDMIFEISPEFF